MRRLTARQEWKLNTVVDILRDVANERPEDDRLVDIVKSTAAYVRENRKER